MRVTQSLWNHQKQQSIQTKGTKHPVSVRNLAGNRWLIWKRQLKRANESDCLKKVIVKSNKAGLMKHQGTSNRGKFSWGLKRGDVGAAAGTQWDRSLHYTLISGSVRFSNSCSSSVLLILFQFLLLVKISSLFLPALFLYIYFRIIMLNTFPMRLDFNEIKFIFKIKI